ncbi:MAG: carboxypeptidase-like regulatory domain-containing protein [Planctomycetota bacterium]
MTYGKLVWEGAYLVDGHARLVPGSLSLRVRASGWGTYPLELAPGEVRVLTASTGCAGRVLQPDGTPAVRAEVWIERDGECVARSRTDADGRFRVGVSQPGRYTLTARDPAQGTGLRTTRELPAPLRIVLRPGATLRGRVLGPDGAPLDSEGVVLTRGGAVQLHAVSGDAGAFELPGIVPGDYELGMDPRRLELAAQRLGRAALELPPLRVTLGSGEAREVVLRAR